jgi:hypothetical protein
MDLRAFNQSSMLCPGHICFCQLLSEVHSINRDIMLKPDSQISSQSSTVFNLQCGLHAALNQSFYITPKTLLIYMSIVAVHNQIQPSYTHKFSTDMKTRMSFQVIC